MSAKSDLLKSKHVIVVGAGFAGVAAARRLATAGVRVTLIDRNRYHTFQPMMYQVATALIAAGDIAYPLAHLAEHHKQLVVINAEVVSVDPTTKTVTSKDGATVSGDYLILATGAEVNFFDTPGSEFTFPMYTLHDADALKTHFVQLLIDASREPQSIDDATLSFVIVGGGATGVETAGHISDLFKDVVSKEFPELANKPVKVTIVDAGSAPLSSFHTKVQEYTVNQLNKLGVTQRFGVEVKSVTADSVSLGDGTSIPAKTVVWAGGSKASALAAQSGLPTGHGGRIEVDVNGEVEGFPGVFVLGDIANTPAPQGGNFPGLGGVALQQCKHAGKAIIGLIEGKNVKSFHYHDKGNMAMISKHSAVAEFGNNHHTLEGPLGFAAWLGVHLYLLEGVRQKTGALTSWAWDFFSSERSQLRVVEDTGPAIDWPGDEPSVAQQDAASGTKTPI